MKFEASVLIDLRSYPRLTKLTYEKVNGWCTTCNMPFRDIRWLEYLIKRQYQPQHHYHPQLGTTIQQG